MRIILLLVIFAGCSNSVQQPDSLIPEEKYISLLAELQLVRSYAENASTDSLSTDSLITVIFNKYNTSNAVFTESHNYYQQFPKDQKERINKAIELLKMDRVESDTTQTVSSDSLDVAS